MIDLASIFQTDRHGKYTEEARICQDILRYSLKIDDNERFSEFELSDWIARKCNSIELQRNIPLKKRPYAVLEKIMPILTALHRLEYIFQRGTKNERNGTDVFRLFQYSPSVRLLAFIIESFNPLYRDEANKQIYNILQSYYNSKKSSTHIFHLVLITKYYNNNVLDDLTGVIRDLVKKISSIPYSDHREIFSIISYTDFIDISKANTFLNMRQRSIDDLGPVTRNLLLYDIKLEFEKKMARNVGETRPDHYEQVRFEMRGDPEQIALQGKCNICSYILTLAYRTVDFLKRSSNLGPLAIKCPDCNNRNCIDIPL